MVERAHVRWPACRTAVPTTRRARNASAGHRRALSTQLAATAHAQARPPPSSTACLARRSRCCAPGREATLRRRGAANGERSTRRPAQTTPMRSLGCRPSRPPGIRSRTPTKRSAAHGCSPSTRPGRHADVCPCTPAIRCQAAAADCFCASAEAAYANACQPSLAAVASSRIHIHLA
jgi:hypothetical protein